MWTSVSGLYINGGGAEAPPLDGGGAVLARAVVDEESGITLVRTGGFAGGGDSQHARRGRFRRDGGRGRRRYVTENAGERRDTERQFDDSPHPPARGDVQNLACSQNRLILCPHLHDVTS